MFIETSLLETVSLEITWLSKSVTLVSPVTFMPQTTIVFNPSHCFLFDGCLQRVFSLESSRVRVMSGHLGSFSGKYSLTAINLTMDTATQKLLKWSEVDRSSDALKTVLLKSSNWWLNVGMSCQTRDQLSQSCTLDSETGKQSTPIQHHHIQDKDLTLTLRRVQQTVLVKGLFHRRQDSHCLLLRGLPWITTTWVNQIPQSPRHTTPVTLSNHQREESITLIITWIINTSNSTFRIINCQHLLPKDSLLLSYWIMAITFLVRTLLVSNNWQTACQCRERINHILSITKDSMTFLM